MFEAVMKVKY